MYLLIVSGFIFQNDCFLPFNDVYHAPDVPIAQFIIKALRSLKMKIGFGSGGI